MALVELVRTTAADGVRLDGALRSPEQRGSRPLAADGALLVHGTGGNFYSSAMLTGLAERMSSLGLTTLQVNTRGHDAVSTAHTPQGSRRLGGAYEIVGDCVLDLGAWTGALRERGCCRLVVVGHSLGALKCAYWLAREPVADVAALVAVSPPRIVHRALAAGPRGAEFLRDYAEAQRLAAEGHGQQLMEISYPLPYLITADGFLDKYGPEERYDVLAALPRVATRWLAVLAEHELGGAAFAGMPDACRACRGDVVIVQGTDHFYSGAHGELADHVERWLRAALASA